MVAPDTPLASYQEVWDWCMGREMNVDAAGARRFHSETGRGISPSALAWLHLDDERLTANAPDPEWERKTTLEWLKSLDQDRRNNDSPSMLSDLMVEAALRALSVGIEIPAEFKVEWRDAIERLRSQAEVALDLAGDVDPDGGDVSHWPLPEILRTGNRGVIAQWGLLAHEAAAASERDLVSLLA